MKKTIIAFDLVAFNCALDESRVNGYKRLQQSDVSAAIDEDGRTWYRAILERESDMRFKIFGL
jgi:hypothetical protein